MARAHHAAAGVVTSLVGQLPLFTMEPDLVARRSPLPGLPYLLTQGSRLRRGVSAMVGAEPA